ncbi:endonuclease III [Phascolarctobacterium sp.]
MRKQQREAILALLEETYKGTETALHYSTPFELLVAVIMSAQCTDERVNKITARIFPKYNTPEKMGALSQEQLEEEIRDCGLFRSKAKNLLATCKMLVEVYGSVIPDTIEELMKLPGVGKKTANVVASIVYKVPAIAVDTHVFRVSHRLGLAKGDDPLAVEQELQKAIPKNKWSDAHHWLIWHGRRICKARKPLCSE